MIHHRFSAIKIVTRNDASCEFHASEKHTRNPNVFVPLYNFNLLYDLTWVSFLYFSYWTINIHIISILSIYSYFYTSCKKNLYDKKYIYITKISCHFIKFKTKNLSPDLIKFCKEKKIRYNGKFYGFFPYDAVLDPWYFIISWNKKKLFCLKKKSMT